MMLVYKIKTNNAHLIFGLRERVRLGWIQKSHVKEIMDKIEELDQKVSELLDKYKSKHIKELMEKAKSNKELDKELVYFMNKIYPNYQRKIIEMVDVFNTKYCPNYEELLKHVRKE